MAEERKTGTFKMTAQIGGAGAQVPILHSRTRVFVDGMPAGQEVVVTSTSISQMSEHYVDTKDVGYAITGQVNVDIGEGTVNFNPALPAGVWPEVQAFVDFERKPDLAPHINTKAVSYSLYCAPSLVLMQVTPDSNSQTRAEWGADGLTIAVQANPLRAGLVDRVGAYPHWDAVWL
ncbi:hypothetical protein [Pseudomonas alabamensis]|uniref:hypothetical protein n=1 Tax=Pseudomonas alabamensis TaxID=3064349 RepID=UPI003F651974